MSSRTSSNSNYADILKLRGNLKNAPLPKSGGNNRRNGFPRHIPLHLCSHLEHSNAKKLSVLETLRTTHLEFGVRMVIDLDACFFSPRLDTERQRLCQEVQRGENVLVAFAGCGPEVLQLLAHSQAESITAVELNPAALRCLRRSLEMRKEKVKVIEGDLLQVAPSLGHFQRILAPRPKLPGDGDLDQGQAGRDFLRVLLPLLSDRGVCHWYDFAADWELPNCQRTCDLLEAETKAQGLSCRILRVAAANRRSIAERQYRVVVDFQVSA